MPVEEREQVTPLLFLGAQSGEHATLYIAMNHNPSPETILDLQDRIEHHCRAIETLAILLVCAGGKSTPYELNAITISNAGTMIQDHITALRESAHALKQTQSVTICDIK